MVLATTFLDAACQDASRIHISEDIDLPEGISANAASHRLESLKLVLSTVLVLI